MRIRNILSTLTRLFVDELEVKGPKRLNIREALLPFFIGEEITRGPSDPRQSTRRNDNDIVMIKLSMDGPASSYIAHKIKTPTPRLVGEIFTPVDHSNNCIIVNWAGTHNLATLLADFETSPALESYRQYESLILEQIRIAVVNHYLQRSEKVKLIMAGHSAGGGLAQLTFHTLQKTINANIPQLSAQQVEPIIVDSSVESELAEKYFLMQKETVDDSKLSSSNIESLSLHVWNSVGELKLVTKETNDLAKIVHYTGIKQKAYYGMVGGDFAQVLGESSALYDVDPLYAEVSVAKFDIGKEGCHKTALKMMLGAIGGSAIFPQFAYPILALGSFVSITYFSHGCYAAHNVKHFENCDNIDKLKFTLHTNQTLSSAKHVFDELTNKSSFLNALPPPNAKRIVQNGLFYMWNKVPPVNDVIHSASESLKECLNINRITLRRN